MTGTDMIQEQTREKMAPFASHQDLLTMVVCFVACNAQSAAVGVRVLINRGTVKTITHGLTSDTTSVLCPPKFHLLFRLLTN